MSICFGQFKWSTCGGALSSTRMYVRKSYHPYIKWQFTVYYICLGEISNIICVKKIHESI